MVVVVVVFVFVFVVGVEVTHLGKKGTFLGKRPEG